MSRAATIVVGLIRGYQRTFSAMRGPVCRFIPTCSQYTIEALQRHGLIRGLYAGLRRVLRCHPCSRGGYDPVD